MVSKPQLPTLYLSRRFSSLPLYLPMSTSVAAAPIKFCRFLENLVISCKLLFNATVYWQIWLAFPSTFILSRDCHCQRTNNGGVCDCSSRLKLYVSHKPTMRTVSQSWSSSNPVQVGYRQWQAAQFIGIPPYRIKTLFATITYPAFPDLTRPCTTMILP